MKAQRSGLRGQDLMEEHQDKFNLKTKNTSLEGGIFFCLSSKKCFFCKKREIPIKTSNYSGKNNSNKCMVAKISTLIP